MHHYSAVVSSELNHLPQPYLSKFFLTTSQNSFLSFYSLHSPSLPSSESGRSSLSESSHLAHLSYILLKIPSNYRCGTFAPNTHWSENPLLHTLLPSLLFNLQSLNSLTSMLLPFFLRRQTHDAKRPRHGFLLSLNSHQ
ncbi:hypothetical protein Bca4012_076223 [Brassica carinata]|uniref:Uncharacterized protein n=1 Tax=Brassica oleracea TaxID=3712 RepID=A0A3P6EE38_BRAOL|nr:unnamed protein product [Brassica oleracea]